MTSYCFHSLKATFSWLAGCWADPSLFNSELFLHWQTARRVNELRSEGAFEEIKTCGSWIYILAAVSVTQRQTVESLSAWISHTSKTNFICKTWWGTGWQPQRRVESGTGGGRKQFSKTKACYGRKRKRKKWNGACINKYSILVSKTNNSKQEKWDCDTHPHES